MTAVLEKSKTQISYDEYNVTRVSATSPETKTVPNTGPNAVPPSPAQTYYQIPLMYNYGTDEKKKIDDFIVEGCELTSDRGIVTKTGQNNKVEHSVMVKFDINNPECAKFMKTIEDIHLGCAYILGQMKGPVKLFTFDYKNPAATGFKSPLYEPRDEATGEKIQGRAPSMFMKLFSRGSGPFAEQSLFTDLEGKPIPWSLLEAVEMKFIPLIHIKRIYIGGGKAILQMEIKSAIVTSVKARNSASTQTDTLNKLKSARPELVDQVQSMLAKLAADRQDILLGKLEKTDDKKTDDKKTEEKPTFGGVAPTPAFNDMSSFTASAPSRPGSDGLPAIKSFN